MVKEVESKSIPVIDPEEERRSQPMTLDGLDWKEKHLLGEYKDLMFRDMTVGEYEDRASRAAAHAAEKAALHKKIVDTLNGMWSDPLKSLEGKSDAELNQLYVPGVGTTPGWCEGCYDVRQGYINKGKNDIAPDATLSQYINRVAELKAAAKLLFCAEHAVPPEVKNSDPVTTEQTA